MGRPTSNSVKDRDAKSARPAPQPGHAMMSLALCQPVDHAPKLDSEPGTLSAGHLPLVSLLPLGPSMAKSFLEFWVALTKPDKRLYDLIARMLPDGLVVRQESPLTFADSEPEPDIAVVQGTEAELFQVHPASAALVIEVAVSSPALDRENASLYAEAGVTEYWIVLAPERRIELYRHPENGRYQEMRAVEASETIECAGVPGVRLSASDLFA